MNNPFEPIQNLRDRVAEKAEEIGLSLMQFAVPDVRSGDETVFMGVFVISDEAKLQGDADEQIEQHQFDQAFQSLVEDFSIQDSDDKESEAKQRMLQNYRNLKNMKGGGEGDAADS